MHSSAQAFINHVSTMTKGTRGTTTGKDVYADQQPKGPPILAWLSRSVICRQSYIYRENMMLSVPALDDVRVPLRELLDMLKRRRRMVRADTNMT